MQWYWNRYLPDRNVDHLEYAAPLLAKDLSGLPPAIIALAQHDPLMPEGLDYAKRLEQAGVSVWCKVYPKMIHAFLTMPMALEESDRAFDELAAEIRNAQR